MRYVYRITRTLPVALCCLAASVAIAAQEQPTGDQLLAEAAARIERYRKADAVVRVVDQGGQPVAGAEVQVTQTRHAFLFGCNIFLWGRVGDPKAEAEYRQRFADLFNFATLPFYWPSYERERGKPIHDRIEPVARWCRQHGIRCKGHPLAWNYADPAWLPDDPEEILKLQLERIDDCVGRFRGLIDTWDVVNEVTEYDRAQFKRRAPKYTAMWAKVGQVEMPRRCFLRARAANPDATLLINDYRVNEAYVRVIEGLVDDRGRPLYDVIGIQSHQHGGTWSNEKIWQVCERFARFGVPLHFTETTILSGATGRGRVRRGAWRTTPEGEAWQAREVERFYTMLFSHPAVQAITWWDFSDLRAWQGAPAGLVRKDMSPKPAYKVLHRLIKETWWTRLKARTDRQGVARFRGTLGDYAITVRSPGGQKKTTPMSLVRGRKNEQTIQLP